MSDPTRLLDGDGEAEKTLLRAWGTRQPSEAARLRTLAVLGVSGLVVTGGVGASVAPKAAVASASLLKWLVVGGGVVASVGAASYVAVRAAAPEPRALSATAPAPASDRAAAPVRTPAASPAWTASPAQETPPAPAAVAVPPVSAGAPAVPRAAAGSSLDEEVVAIEHARAALAAGDAAGALQLVDAYDARYPSGALSQESADIRIEALFRAGKRAQAERLAARFLAAHPTSPYARVIRSLSTGAPATGP